MKKTDIARIRSQIAGIHRRREVPLVELIALLILVTLIQDYNVIEIIIVTGTVVTIGIETYFTIDFHVNRREILRILKESKTEEEFWENPEVVKILGL